MANDFSFPYQFPPSGPAQAPHVQADFDAIRQYLLGLISGTVSLTDLITKFPIVDVRYYSSINAAVTAIGATKRVLLIPTAQTLTGSLTIPSNITLLVLNSGSIVKASSYTLTINGPVVAKDYQVFSGFSAGDVTGLSEVYPDWFGTGTTAWQSALDSLQIGGKVNIAPKTYTVTGALTLNVNRILFEGQTPELSLVNYTPGSNNTAWLTVPATCDNVYFKNFQIQQTNQTTYPSTTGILVQTGATKITWDHMFFARFAKYGISCETGTYYLLAFDCRFSRIRDTTSTNDSTAFYSAGSNSVTIRNCYFTECDKHIHIAAGARIMVFDNEMETGGDSGNTLRQYYDHFVGVISLVYLNNYVEGNDTQTGGAALYLDGCKGVTVRGNYWNGQDGPSDKTDIFIKVRGAGTRNITIENNNLVEVITYFVDTDQNIILRDNYFVDAGAEISTLAGLTPYINGFSSIDYSVFSGSTRSDVIGGNTVLQLNSTTAIFPRTTNQLRFGVTNTVTLNAAAPASSSTWTIPDVGTTGTFAALEGTQTFTGNKTFTGTITTVISPSKVIVTDSSSRLTDSVVTVTELGRLSGVTSSVQTQIDSKAASNLAFVTIGNTSGLSAERALTGTSNQVVITDNGANSTVVLSTPQDIATSSTPTFASETLTATTNQLVLGTTRTVTLTAPTPATSSRTVTFPDLVGDYSVVGTIGTQSIAGAKTFTSNLTVSKSSPSITVTDGASTNGAYTRYITNTSQTLYVGSESSTGGNLITGSAAYAGIVGTDGAQPVQIGTSNAIRLTVDSSGNIVPGTAALSTGASTGFTYIQTCAGAPSGTPTAYTGRAAMVYDSTNNNFYIYNGAWKKVLLA